MKKIFIFFIAVVMLFSVTACGEVTPANSTTSSAPVNETSEPLASEFEPDISETIEDEPTTTQKEETTTTIKEESTTTQEEFAGTTRQTTKFTTKRSVRSTETRTTKTSKTITTKTTKTSKTITMKTTETTKTSKPTTTTSEIGEDMITWETPDTNYTNKYADYIQYRTPLTNSYNKLAKDKELKVLYLGGSLTNGSGASSMDKESWRGLTGQWLTQTFPQAHITNINVAIGSTGSELGVYRLEQNVIAQKPDLLFVEFAINDHYYSTGNKLKPSASFEALIRETRQKLPYCDIVVLITADRGCVQQYYGTSTFPHSAANAHMELAQAYGLSVINIADAFVNEVAEITDNKKWFNDTKLWNKYVTDVVHPNADGYAMWFNYVKEYLENSLLNTDYSTCKTTARKVPAVQSIYLLDGKRQAYIGSEIKKQIVESDNTFTFANDQSSTSDGYYQLKRGGTVTLKFTGTECAIWTRFEAENFKITYTIDGMDTYTMENKWGDPYYLATNLEAGEHTVKITHCKDSKLPNFNLVGLLMRDATQQTTR